jgi:pSer/pThr/pTyr-binding forkhead associated (FHA) protein
MDRTRQALIELLDRDGRLMQAVSVTTWPVSMGRALDNDVVLDDPHVAAHHGQLLRAEDGTLLLQLGQTINGARLGPRHLIEGESAALDATQDSFEIGVTRVRVRVAEQTLAPERVLPRSTMPRWTTALLLLALVVLTWWPAWLSSDPHREWTEWMPLALGLPSALTLWCLLWALATKLFQHRFDFWGHLRIVAWVMTPLVALDLALPQLAASLAWPALWQAAQWITALTLALLAWRHALLVVPGRPRAMAAVAAVLLVASSLPGLLRQHRQFERLAAAPYMATLPLPAYRWHAAEPVEAFVADVATLQPLLKARVEDAKKDSAEEDDPS